MFLTNPFVIGAYISEEYFCDREEEKEKLIAHLRNGRNVVLFSERRMGKTGLIQHVFHNKQIQKDYYCLYFDAYACGNIQEFTYELTNCIFNKLKGTSSFLEQITAVFRSIQLSLEIDPMTGKPEVGISLGEIKQPVKTLQEAFSVLNTLEKPVILAIDEFQQILSFKNFNTAAFLRGLVQTSSNVKMIYAGSDAHLLSNLFLQSNSPFYQTSTMMHLEAIPADKYFSFAKEKFEKEDKTITEAVFYEIYEEFQGCTWFVQSALNRIYANTLLGEKVPADALEKTVRTLLQEQDVFYRTLLSTLPMVQKALLFAVAKEKTVLNPSSTEFVKKYSLSSVSSTQSASRSLIEKGILRKTDKGLSIYDFLFNAWIKKHYF